jgi:hypothetical protein
LREASQSIFVRRFVRALPQGVECHLEGHLVQEGPMGRVGIGDDGGVRDLAERLMEVSVEKGKEIEGICGVGLRKAGADRG